MAGPWEDYAPQTESGPWQDYAPPPQAPSPATPGALGGTWDALKNAGTGAVKGLSMLLGTPRALNEADAGINKQQADFYSQFPPNLRPSGFSRQMPSAQDIESAAVNAGISPNYVPRTTAGRLFQSGVAGGTAGVLAGPIGMGLGAAGGATQQGLAEVGAPPWMQALGGIAVPALLGAGAAGARSIARPLTQAGKMTTAQNIFDQVMMNKDAPISPAPIQGAPATYGQATNDPGLLAFEKQVVSKPPLSGQFLDLKNRANSAVVDLLRGNANWPGRGDAVPQAQQAGFEMNRYVEGGAQAAKAAERAAWAKVDPNNDLIRPTDPIRNEMEGVAKELGVARSDLLPSYVNDVVNKWGPHVSLNEMRNLNSRIMNDIRDATSGANPDTNRAQALGLAQKVLQKQIDTLAATDPAQQAALNDARAATRNYHAVYDDPITKRVLGNSSNGTSLVPESAVGDRYLSSGRPEGLDAYVKATGGTPEAMQAARDWFMAGLAKSAESKVEGPAGAQTLLSAPYTGYLNRYRALLNDDRLFTPAQRDIIQKGADQLSFTARTENAGVKGGSDTYAKLASDKFLESMVGAKGAKLLSMYGRAKGAIWTGIGGMVAGTPGSMIGSALGSAEARSGIYARAAQASLDIVHKAIMDPQFAADLRAFRANPNAKTLTPRILQALTNSTVNPAGPMLQGPRP